MIRLSPYPDGKDFAVSFVDDTDLSTRANTEPVYDFLASRGFLGAKTVWVLRARRNSANRPADERPLPEEGTGDCLEDPDYLDFARKLAGKGFEIALHGVAAGNSTRDEILAGLEKFRVIFGVDPSINAFHRTNIENLYCGAHKLDVWPLAMLERLLHRSDYQGHREGGRHFWGDISLRTFRFVRLPFHTIARADTRAMNPSMPFHDPRRPWVRLWFASSDGSDRVRFNRLLASSNVERLETRGGASVIYTHFAKGFVRGSGRGAVLDPEFVRAVDHVASRPGAWTPTASTLLERLRSVRRIELVHDGTMLRLRNAGDREVAGLTLVVPPGQRILGHDGRELPAGRGGKVVVGALAEGSVLSYRTALPGSVVVRPATSDAIPRRERRRIEWLNYLGLLEGKWRDRAAFRRKGGK